MPFDLNRLEVTGQPVPAVANITQALNISSYVYNTAAGQFTISASGSMAFALGGIISDLANSLVWVDHKGNAQPIGSFKGPFSVPRLSADGQRLARRRPVCRCQTARHRDSREMMAGVPAENLIQIGHTMVIDSGWQDLKFRMNVACGEGTRTSCNCAAHDGLETGMGGNFG